jgi:two-component system, LytTR family, sensor kinase
MRLITSGAWWSKQSELLCHILMWCFFIGERWINHYPKAENFLIHGLVQTIILLTTFILPTYINAFIFIPCYLKKARWVQYFTFVTMMILTANIFRGLLVTLQFELSHMEYNFSFEFFKWAFRDYVSFDKFVFSPTSWIIWSSFAYRLIKDWILHERVKSKLEAEKTNMELAFLKTQINPHFLFNTLNNLYALSLEEKAAKTSDAITKMGALMRYNLHESQSETILLIKEVDYLQQYIELQKLRIVEESGLKVITDFELCKPEFERIAPMILLPYVENAFKFGVSTVENGLIEIILKLDGGILTMHVKNKIHQHFVTHRGGIGLQNVKNRLALVYPRKHRVHQFVGA